MELIGIASVCRLPFQSASPLPQLPRREEHKPTGPRLWSNDLRLVDPDVQCLLWLCHDPRCPENRQRRSLGGRLVRGGDELGWTRAEQGLQWEDDRRPNATLRALS